jgi:hypothetical protein
VNVLNEIPILILHVLEADIAENTSIVDEDIDATKGLDSGFDDFVTILNAVIVGNSFSAGLLDFVDNDIGSLCDRLDVSRMCVYLIFRHVMTALHLLQLYTFCSSRSVPSATCGGNGEENNDEPLLSHPLP